MTITTRIQEKLDNYRSNVLFAIDFLSHGSLEEAAVRFRRSVEAYMKMLIYNELGDSLGHDVILGNKDQNNHVISKGRSLLYSEMVTLVSDTNRWADTRKKTLLNDIKDRTNGNAHDANEPIIHAVLKTQLDQCFTLSQQLTNIVYGYVGLPVPDEIKQAYADGVVDSRMISELEQSDIDTFLEQIDNFGRGCRYVLVAPFSTAGISREQLRNLMGIRWSMIIDFNCHSKKDGGLYHALQPEIDVNSTPFTILNKETLYTMSRGTSGNVNWIYANGLADIPGTVTADIKAWIGKRYHHFLRDALTEFCKKSLSRIHIISLLEDDEYLTELIRQFDGIDFAERDLVSFSIISDKKDVRENAAKLSLYGFTIKGFTFTPTYFISQMGELLTPEERHTILVPGRNSNNETVLTDVTSIYSKFSSNGINIVHKDIASETSDGIAQLPAFYRGETITWKELEADVDVPRSKYEELQRKVLERLNGRQSQKFRLIHYAGAGGTTVSRRLAYDLREKVPTIIINQYDKIITLNLIELFSMTVNRPVLAIVESSKVGNIDELIADCNARKRIVVFVYVERVLHKPSVISQPQVQFITDKMHDAEEKDKFAYKVQVYNPNYTNMQWIKKTPFTQCEVLDFSMSIAEKDYEKNTLRRYIKQYLNQLSEPTAEFLAYLSMIYYYAQISVSDLVFRKIFVTDKGKTGFLYYMRQRPQELSYLKKLITEDGEINSEDYLWRPRYSLFADIILEELLGGDKPENWKDALPEWSRKLIHVVKSNYDFLTEEVQKMLVAAFLEREKEDLLGQEEVWGAKGAQEKFSQLLDDMSFSPEDQKSILKLLAETYPTVSHFWGHLARYCYENADTPEQFSEAAGYIEKALEKNGKNDFNLLHIAGMCRRRLIEYYHRSEVALEQEELKSITDTARDYFRQSREVNPRNVHAYMSEIQLLTIVIEYGKSLSNYDKYSKFLVASENKWFFELYEELNELIDELTTLLNQISTLGLNTRFYRTKTMLAKSESKSWEYVGDFKESLRILKEHISNADRLSLPRLRIMYVRTLLLSKVRGNREKVFEAWELLTAPELSMIEDYLDKNVQQNSGDVVSMRLWIQFIRYSGVQKSIEEVKSRLKMMYKNSDAYPMTKLEAAYNLYILNLFELIRDNDTMNVRKKEEIQYWIDNCRKLSLSDKYPFEWLVNLNDISGIVSSINKPDFSLLERISGTITEIKSNVQGTIRLDCGFDVFFTPAVGNFIQGKDETTRVEMVIAFRHEGPAAYEVCRPNSDNNQEVTRSGGEELKELEISEVEAIEPEVVQQAEIKEELTSKYTDDGKPHLTVLGKIDLSKFEKYERRRKPNK